MFLLKSEKKTFNFINIEQDQKFYCLINQIIIFKKYFRKHLKRAMEKILPFGIIIGSGIGKNMILTH